jgi:hypothetical protein
VLLCFRDLGKVTVAHVRGARPAVDRRGKTSRQKACLMLQAGPLGAASGCGNIRGLGRVSSPVLVRDTFSKRAIRGRH